MCDLLGASDERTVCVLLDGLNNILSAARKQGEVDKVCAVIEECEGLDKIESLQTHENEEVYQKALEIIDTFFTEEVKISTIPHSGNQSTKDSLVKLK